MPKIGAELHLSPEARDLELDRVRVGSNVERENLDGHVLPGAALNGSVHLGERSGPDPVGHVVPFAKRWMLEDAGDPIQAHAELRAPAGEFMGPPSGIPERRNPLPARERLRKLGYVCAIRW